MQKWQGPRLNDEEPSAPNYDPLGSIMNLPTSAASSMNATLTPRKPRTDSHSTNTTGERQLGASELVEITSVYFDAVSSAISIHKGV